MRLSRPPSDTLVRMANKKSSKPSKGRKRSDPSKELEVDHFGILLEESEKLCAALDLPQDLILQIARTDSDWAFTLKIDALLEAASKAVIRHGLRFKLLNRVIQNDTLGEFVDSLPMAGRTSLLVLLGAAGFSPEDCGLIDAVRKLRNAYAHNIKNVDTRLIELIKQRGDKSQLIRKLSPIATYEEKSLIASYEKDGVYLRFLITMSAMRVLFVVYHLSLKPGRTTVSGPSKPRVVRS
jgi:hypothetical protein